MTPLKDTPLRRQTDALIDRGQQAWSSGSKANTDVTGTVGRATDGVGQRVGL